MKSIIILIFLIILKVTPAFALEDIGYSKIHPASFFYFLKTIREDLEVKSAQTSRVKMLRSLEFSTRRLREARTLVSINQDLIQSTLERYNVQLKTLPDENLKDPEVLARIKESLVVHLQVLQKMHADAQNPRAKMSIRSAMNRIIQRTDVPSFARAPVCSFFAKEALSSSLNQTEQVVLAERAQKCLKTNK